MKTKRNKKNNRNKSNNRKSIRKSIRKSLRKSIRRRGNNKKTSKIKKRGGFLGFGSSFNPKKIPNDHLKTQLNNLLRGMNEYASIKSRLNYAGSDKTRKSNLINQLKVEYNNLINLKKSIRNTKLFV